MFQSLEVVLCGGIIAIYIVSHVASLWVLRLATGAHLSSSLHKEERQWGKACRCSSAQWSLIRQQREDGGCCGVSGLLFLSGGRSLEKRQDRTMLKSHS